MAQGLQQIIGIVAAQQNARTLGHQFGHGGTDALESPRLWDVPEIRRAGGLDALRRLGRPVDVIQDAKMRLFGV